MGNFVSQNPVPEKFGTRSLSIRISFLIFVFCIMTGSIGAYLMLTAEKNQLINQEHRFLSMISLRYTNQFSRLMEDKIDLARSANSVVRSALFNNPPDTSLPTINLTPDPDGGIRSSDHFSAAYMPESDFTGDYKYLFSDSERLWRNIAPVMTEQFFNYYLITKDNFIRITPKDVAFMVGEENRFKYTTYFDLAGPEKNPQRRPVWTPVYFNEIWSQWMTSLLVPVYKNFRLVALTGSDFVLDNIFNNFRELAGAENGRQIFLFDQSGTMLISPDFANRQPVFDSVSEAQQNVLNAQLAELMKEAAESGKQEIAGDYMFDGTHYLVNTRLIEEMGWYVAVYNQKEEALSPYYQLRTRLIVVFLVTAAIIGFLLQQALYHMGLKRINALVQTACQLAEGNWSVRMPKPRNDEIGALSKAFAKMAGNINELFEGLHIRMEEKEKAEKSARKLSKAVAYSSNGIVITDQQLMIEYVNPKFCEMTGRTETYYKEVSVFDIIAQDMAFLSEDIRETIRVREQWRGDILLKTRNKAIWITLSIAPIFGNEGEVTNYVCSAQDISFIKESQRKMEQLAYYDVLTGLANRTYFKMELKKSLALSQRGHYSFALFYFDLDEFKRINDTLGHDVGDKLLVEVARRLKDRLRTEDTISRLGGDEFAILLSGAKEKFEVQKVAEVIQTILVKPFRLANNEVFVSASIGITMAPFDSDDEEALLKRADLAMYEAKRLGKNTYYFYSNELDVAAKDQLIIENELRVALKDNQLELYYQPQIDTRTGKIVGLEALIRWRHPEKGMIPPIKFIPIAEMTGLVVQLGEWVLWEACKFAQFINKEYHFDGKVAVNLSARQFKELNLPMQVSHILQETGLDARSLGLEITESMLMGDIEAAIRQLHDLKNLGLNLSIDDFGTGYSSLSYLKRFPVDIIKVDRSFIKDIPKDRSDLEIASAIIAMGQKLNIGIVAEGVESEPQIDFLQKNRCYVVQGYYYSPPLTANGIEELLRNHSGYIHAANKEDERQLVSG